MSILNRATNLFKNAISSDSAIVSFLHGNGISGFKFHVPQTEQVKFESEITDHYTDSNNYFADHVALRPITITVSGLQGEYFYDLHPIENAISTVTTTLKLIEIFKPDVTEIANQVKSKISKKATATKLNEEGAYFEVGTTAEYHKFNAMQLWSLFQNMFKLKSAQTRAFLFFEALWEEKAMFSVETSWKRYDNMIIQSLTPVRDNNADITDFSITFKQIRFTDSYQIPIEAIGRTATQKSNIDVKAQSLGENKEV